jgi:hypothetical protein
MVEHPPLAGQERRAAGDDPVDGDQLPAGLGLLGGQQTSRCGGEATERGGDRLSGPDEVTSIVW